MSSHQHCRRTAIALLLGMAVTSAMANSFMLAPGMPSFEELGRRNFAAERHLESLLKGADREAFEKRREELRADELPKLTYPRGDASRYSGMWQRWNELEALLNKHDPAFLKDLAKSTR